MGQRLKAAIVGNTPFWLCLGISIFLLLGGALTPPPFQIDNSIFVGVGELFSFAALWAFIKALEMGKDAKIRHNDTEVMIGDISEPEPRYPEFDRPSPKTEDYE